MDAANNQLYLGAAKSKRDVTLGFWWVEPGHAHCGRSVAGSRVRLGQHLSVLLTGGMTSRTYYWPRPNTCHFSFLTDPHVFLRSNVPS